MRKLIDVLIFGWVREKHLCADLIGFSPLTGLSIRGFTAGQAALKVVVCKVTKHEKSCIENQHMFIPFAFDTFGFFAPEAVELLSRVQRIMHINIMTPRSTDVVFKRIGFAIKKGLATQLVPRLPSTLYVNCMEKVDDSVDENSWDDLYDLKETINEFASNKIQHPISKENMNQEDDINKVSP
uniref:Signal recognition particle, SRP19 subunit n=1 Tax=Tanacetum cinerariifolium TaxID=118510 RepID=A0A699IQL4_TANCI|nr:signal recognition particle, SRP19 subunit [Tanacetum cinerariifolium]